MKPSIKSCIVPNILILPVVLRWLLPVVIENSLYFNICGIYFFIPDFLYVVYIAHYKRNDGIVRNKNLSLLYLLITFVFTFLHLLISEGNLLYKINVVINSFSFIYIPFVYIRYPLSAIDFEKIKYTLIFSLFFLGGEVLLYSTGLLTYTSATGNDLTAGLYETGGIMRISTTVGAATGTAIIILLLGCIITGYYKMSRLKLYGLILFVSIVLLFTVSRGSLLIWALYVLIHILRDFNTISWNKRILFVIVIILTFILLMQQGFFDPLMYRLEANIGNQTTGRNDLNIEAIDIIHNSSFMGVGIGTVFPEKIIQYKLNVSNYIGMHNTYLTYIAEIGVVGFFFLFLVYNSVLRQINLLSSLIAIVPFCMLIISFNTESVFVDQEFIAPFYLLILAILNIQKHKVKQKITYNKK